MARPYIDVASPILQAFFQSQAQGLAEQKMAQDQENEIARRDQQAKQFQERMKIEQTNLDLRRKANEAAQKHQQFVEKIQDEQLKQKVLEGIKTGKLPVPIEHTQNVDDAAMHGIPYEMIPNIKIGGTEIPAGMVPYGFQADTEIAQGHRQRQLDLNLAGIQQRMAQMNQTAADRAADRTSRETIAANRIQGTKEAAAIRASRNSAKEGKSDFELEAAATGKYIPTGAKLSQEYLGKLKDFDWGDGNIGAVPLRTDHVKSLEGLAQNSLMIRNYAKFRKAIKEKNWGDVWDYGQMVLSSAAKLREEFKGLGVLSDTDLQMLRNNLPTNKIATLRGILGDLTQVDRIIQNRHNAHIVGIKALGLPDGQLKYFIKERELDIPRIGGSNAKAK